MTSIDTYYQASGSSPPGHDPVQGVATEPSEPLPLPPELIEDLASLLADAIVADIRLYPNLAELHANQQVTDESPSGHNRRRQAGTPADHPPVARQTRRVAEAS